MAELFSTKWMDELKKHWNNSPQVYEPLKKAEFSARIAYGFKGEPRARGILTVVNGMVTHASSISNDELAVVNGVVSNAASLDNDKLDWDLRASQENWNKWIENGFGLAKLGPAIATNSLEFAKGNYRQMIANPSLSSPFLQHFALMTKI